MAPVKIGFHSFDWFEPRTDYKKGKKKLDSHPKCLCFHWKLISVLCCFFDYFFVSVFILS